MWVVLNVQQQLWLYIRYAIAQRYGTSRGTSVWPVNYGEPARAPVCHRHVRVVDCRSDIRPLFLIHPNPTHESYYSTQLNPSHRHSANHTLLPIGKTSHRIDWGRFTTIIQRQCNISAVQMTPDDVCYCWLPSCTNSNLINGTPTRPSSKQSSPAYGWINPRPTLLSLRHREHTHVENQLRMTLVCLTWLPVHAVLCMEKTRHITRDVIRRRLIRSVATQTISHRSYVHSSLICNFRDPIIALLSKYSTISRFNEF